MRQYLDLLGKVMKEGADHKNRTGVDQRGIFGYQMRFDLSRGFPLLTTKKMALRSIIYELLWFLKGDNNLRYLAENNVHIWDEWPFKAYLLRTNQNVPPVGSEEWNTKLKDFVEKIKADEAFAKEYGNLGPIYGYQWRHWKRPDGTEIDQIAKAVENIKAVKLDPNHRDSRRIIVSAWNVSDIEDMNKAGLPPCHALFQFYVSGGKLSCQLYQRSADIFLGVPFNITSYALLTMMIAQVTDLLPGEFVHTLGDAHIYKNHFEQVREQLTRQPREQPTMKINPAVKDIFAFKFEDFILENYDPHPAIKAPIAV